jgi:multisubunit Na+/H+ antiporter MnhB subunit
METHDRINRYLYYVGMVTLFLGAFDPLEGSILIGAGSMLLAITTYRRRDAQWKFFLTAFILIIVGVLFLFYFSSLGGFGGNSTLSWWWALLILPYPVGWLMEIIMLFIRAYRKPRNTIHG